MKKQVNNRKTFILVEVNFITAWKLVSTASLTSVCDVIFKISWRDKSFNSDVNITAECHSIKNHSDIKKEQFLIKKIVFLKLKATKNFWNKLSS